MHLLLGHPQDPCCRGVLHLLEARNHPARLITNPMAHPSRFAWRLDNTESASQFAWDDEQPIADDDLAGVLVRSTGWIDPAGWEAADLAYMQAETQAALLAWLWSLACPVVNRLPSALWYRPRVPPLSWQRMMRQCGLPTPEILVTNMDEEARAFGRRLDREGVDGTVYGPLTSDARYLVSGDADWNGLAVLQRSAPVSLTYPHGEARLACVVGDQVVWEGDPYSRNGCPRTGLAALRCHRRPDVRGIGPCAHAARDLRHTGGASRQLRTLRRGCSRTHRGSNCASANGGGGLVAGALRRAFEGLS